MAHEHDDHAHHGHGHDGHDHDEHSLRSASARSLIFVLALTLCYMAFEIFMFFESNSLALLAHASHMLRDVAVIIMSLFAFWLSGRGSSVAHTYGRRRADVLAAMINALSLWLIAGFIFYNAFGRITSIGEEHGHHEIEGLTVLLVGGIGLVVNLISVWVLHSTSRENVNVQGVFQHVIVDLMTTFGVIVSGVLVLALDWDAADHYISVAIGVLILISSWRLVTRVLRVLMESAPEHIDVYRLCSEIEDIEGVTLIHDVHVWTIAPGYESFTAHIIIEQSVGEDGAREILDKAHDIVRDRFSVDHITIQIDKPPVSCVEEDHLDHLQGRSREEVLNAGTN